MPDRELRRRVVRIAASLPMGSPERRAILAVLKGAGHSARDIGPDLIAAVGKRLGIGDDWYKGALYEAIGDEIVRHLNGKGAREMDRILQPVVDFFLADGGAKIKERLQH